MGQAMGNRKAFVRVRSACLCVCSVLAVALACDVRAMAAVGTAITYQGQLTQNGAAATGTPDMVFELFGQFDGGTPLATLVANNVPLDADGRFTVDLDFGNQFNGQERWLQITVEGETLYPRQPLMAAPYAIYALSGGSGGGAGGWVDKGDETHIMDDVGIGTTDPEAKLHVMTSSAGNVTAHNESVGVFERSGDAFISILTPNDRERGVLFGDPEHLSNGGIIYNSPITPDGFNFRTGGNVARMVLTNTGNVGIGTTNPQHPLHVNGILRVGGSTTGLGGADGDYLFIQPNSTGLATFRFDQANLRFQNSNWGEIMRLNRDGEVGIGTTNPGARLDVTRTDNGTVLRVGGNGTSTGINVSSANIGVQVNGLSSTGTAFHAPSITGSARAASFYGNTTSPLMSTWNDGTGPALQVQGASDASPSGGGLLIVGATNSGNIAIDTNEIMARSNGAASSLLLNRDGGDVVVGSASGGTSRIVTPVIQITGGSDLSEQFDVATVGDVVPTPGMVVCIDPRNPGKLIPSTRAYDRTVAGVISGANGVKTGMMMGQHGTAADGAHAVALTGRVYVMVQAGDEAIEPGDLLTTSDAPGCAMKVSDHDAAQGAILGKAMTRLEAGERGMVLVLVSLQ